MKSSRAEVFAVLSTERDYQESTPGDVTRKGFTLSVGAEILLLQKHIAAAGDIWASAPEFEQRALKEIAVTGAVAIRCMETHGAIGRMGTGKLGATSLAHVFAVINEERSYQDNADNDVIAPGSALSVADEILLIEQYLFQARALWAKAAAPEVDALKEIRKVAAMCVRCMETHGAWQSGPAAAAKERATRRVAAANQG